VKGEACIFIYLFIEQGLGELLLVKSGVEWDVGLVSVHAACRPEMGLGGCRLAAGWAQSCSVRAMPWNCGEKAATGTPESRTDTVPYGRKSGSQQCGICASCGAEPRARAAGAAIMWDSGTVACVRTTQGRRTASSGADRRACQAVRRYGRSRSGRRDLCSSAAVSSVRSWWRGKPEPKGRGRGRGSSPHRCSARTVERRSSRT